MTTLLIGGTHGESWDQVLEPMIRTLLTDPRYPNRLYAGTQPAAAWRSDDGGDTWRELATLGTPAERDGARSRLFRSGDDGATWDHLGSRHGLPDAFEGLISALATDPADPYTIWLGTWDGRVYLSRDRGDTWTQTAEDLGDIWTLCPLPE